MSCLPMLASNTLSEIIIDWNLRYNIKKLRDKETSLMNAYIEVSIYNLNVLSKTMDYDEQDKLQPIDQFLGPCLLKLLKESQFDE